MIFIVLLWLSNVNIMNKKHRNTANETQCTGHAKFIQSRLKKYPSCERYGHLDKVLFEVGFSAFCKILKIS